jgi:hypothetical protein
MPRQKKKLPKNPTAANPANHRSRALMIVDNAAIRKRAVKHCERAEKKVAEAKSQLEVFEARDLPRFASWEARTFGPFMSELRDLEALIGPKLQLLDEIQDEIFLSSCSEVEAYRRVMHARENPSVQRDEPPGGNGMDDFAGEEPFGFEDGPGGFDPFSEPGSEPTPLDVLRDFFPPGFRAEEWDQMSHGDRKEVRWFYERMRAEFEALFDIPIPPFDVALQILLHHSHSRPSGGRKRARSGEELRPDAPPSQRDASPNDPAARLKALYRQLVRELHPDHNPEQTPEAASLWHQVQTAYAAKDIETLEAIVGRTHLAHPEKKASLTVSVLLRIVEQLESALHGLNKRIRQVRKHPAWQFDEGSKRIQQFVKQRERELRCAIDAARVQLQALTTLLDRLAARAARNKKQKASPRRKREPAFADLLQTDLPF